MSEDQRSGAASVPEQSTRSGGAATDECRDALAILQPLAGQYREVRPRYLKYARALRANLIGLLSEEGIPFLLVEARAKKVKSLIEKTIRKQYDDPLTQATDLCGARIVLYYSDDVGKVCDAIAQTFRVDETRSNSTDTVQDRLGCERFGYNSASLIVTPRVDPHADVYLRPFRDLPAEVQIRTVLQHGWALVSWNLQYKNESLLPQQLRRRINRLSALLELVDEQFWQLRDEHQRAIATAQERLAADELDMPLDAVSVSEYVSTAEAPRRAVASAVSADFSIYRDGSDYRQVISACALREIQSIEDLDRELSLEEPNLRAFFNGLLTAFSRPVSPFPTGLVGSPDHVLALVLIGKAAGTLDAIEVTARLGWRDDYANAVLLLGRHLTDPRGGVAAPV